MGYRRYNRRSKTLGAVVTDSARAANRSSPVGALVLGITGFTIFFWLLPWWLTTLAAEAEANMTGPYAVITRQFFDELFFKRFVHPSELAGIAILLVCTCVALWKVLSGYSLPVQGESKLSYLARVLARLID